MATRIDGASHSGHGLSNRIPLVCEGATAWPNGEQLARQLSNGDWAVLLFNRLNTSLTLTLTFTDIGDTTQVRLAAALSQTRLPKYDRRKHLLFVNGFRTIVLFSQTSFAVRDVWARKDLGKFSKLFIARDVPPHGNVFLRLRAVAPPPPPRCPTGYTSHAAGFWQSTPSFPCHGGDCVMSNATCSIGGPDCQFGVSINDCAKQCNSPPPPGIAPGLRCTAFEVFDPEGTSACFNFFGVLTGFEADDSCFACVKA